MSEYIYTSEKAVPYVYWGTHKTTDEYYIGYHMTNVAKNIPSHLDLGIKYFTSSAKVEERGFENFDWTIIVEFFNPDLETAAKEAHSFEQDLIGKYLGLPGCLNGYANEKWHTIGQNPFKNKTPEEMKLIRKLGKINQMRINQLIRKKQSDLQLNISEEEILLRNKKRSLGHLNRSEEEKEITSQKHKENWKNRPEEIKILARDRRLASMNNRTDEQKANTSILQSDAARKRKGIPVKKLICPYCQKEGGNSNMTRYHFDNCKIKPKS